MWSPFYIRPPFDDFSHDKLIFADHPSAERTDKNSKQKPSTKPNLIGL
jgi:hypothetical protein